MEMVEIAREWLGGLVAVGGGGHVESLLIVIELGRTAVGWRSERVYSKDDYG